MARMTYRDAVSHTIGLEMERDPSVFLMGEDVAPEGAFKTTAGLAARFGDDRVRNTPIAEQAILGAALGAAMNGMRPIAEIMFGDFLGVCFDYIVNQIPAWRYSSGGQVDMPLVIKSSTGGGIGFASQHSHAAENWVMTTPGIKVVVPSNAADYKGLMTAAIRDPDPVVVFEVKALYPQKGDVPHGEHVIPLGQASVIGTGEDVVIIALGSTVKTALSASQLLQERGIRARVIDLRCLVPLDTSSVLEHVRAVGRVVIVEEGPAQLSWGATIAAIIADEAFSSLKGPIRRLSSANVPTPYAGVLEAASRVSVAQVLATAEALMNG